MVFFIVTELKTKQKCRYLLYSLLKKYS